MKPLNTLGLANGILQVVEIRPIHPFVYQFLHTGRTQIPGNLGDDNGDTNRR